MSVSIYTHLAIQRSRGHVRRGLGGLEESLSADLALDAHGFLILEQILAVAQNEEEYVAYALGLRLGSLGVLRVALALHVGLGSL